MLGSSPPDSLTVGQVARSLGVPPRRIEWWVERGFLRAVGIGCGPGKRRYIPRAELPIAQRVLAEMTRLGVKATDKLFEVARAQAA